MNLSNISDYTWETSLRDTNSLWVPNLCKLLFPYFGKKKKKLYNLTNTWAVSKLRRATLFSGMHVVRVSDFSSAYSDFIVCTHLISVLSDCMDLTYFSKGDKK